MVTHVYFAVGSALETMYLLRGRDILRLTAASKHSNYVSFYMRISLTCSHAFAQLITPRGEPLPRPIPPPASIVVNLI